MTESMTKQETGRQKLTNHIIQTIFKDAFYFSEVKCIFIHESYMNITKSGRAGICALTKN
jgi:hypothetical protein